MRKLRNFWGNIPRPAKALANLLLILLLAVTFYISIGAPSLTEELAFRRAEKAQLVGPSTILFSEDVESYDFQHLILAETELGVITYATDETWHPQFFYTEKTGDVTMVAAPKGPFRWGYSNWAVKLPVFIVDDVPEAVRAELEIDIVGTHIMNLNSDRVETPLDHHYALEADREGEGFFRFNIELPYLDSLDKYGNNTYAEHGADGYALDLLAETFGCDYSTRSNASITAAVRLYDRSGNLITERNLTLREPNEES